MLSTDILQILNGVPRITELYDCNDLPNTNTQYGDIQLLYSLRKPVLVGITSTLGVRNSNSLRKYSLTCLIWLGIPLSFARHFDWILDFKSPVQLDCVRYLFEYYYSNVRGSEFGSVFPNIMVNGESPLPIQITPNLIFNNSNNIRALYSFSYHFFYLIKCIYGNDATEDDVFQLTNRCRSLTVDIWNHVVNNEILTPSQIRTRSRRNFNPRTRRVVEKIPEHIKTDYIRMFTKLDIKQDCPICLQSLNDIHLTHCGHMFHQRCVNQVMTRGNRLCPTCRAPIIN